MSYDGEIIIKCPGGPEGDSIRDEEDDVQIRDEAEGRGSQNPGDAYALQPLEETGQTPPEVPRGNQYLRTHLERLSCRTEKTNLHYCKSLYLWQLVRAATGHLHSCQTSLSILSACSWNCDQC